MPCAGPRHSEEESSVLLRAALAADGVGTGNDPQADKAAGAIAA